MDGLGVPMDEFREGKFETENVSAFSTVAGYICASSPFADDHEKRIYDIKMDEFEQLAEMLIRALAVEHALEGPRIDDDA